MVINSELTRHGYIINKADITNKEYESIKKDLTVTPLSFNDEVKPYKLYQELKNDRLCMPRYYGVKRFGKPKKVLMKADKINVEFKGNLREYQNTIIDACVPAMKKKGGGLISVPCGFGKTTISLKLVTMFQLKTLIVVHKTCLYDQWIERVKQFIPNARVGIIRQNKIKVEDYDIVIGTIQSISMKKYDPKIFQGFGIVIYDEAHTCPSRVFSKALYKTGAKYTIALTATPNRVDGLRKILHWYLGDIMFMGKRKKDKNVIAKVFHFTSKSKLFVEKKAWNKKQGKPTASVPIMVNNLCKIDERTQHIINVVNELRKQPNRKILILSHRIEHLKILKNAVDKLIAEDIKNSLIDENEVRTCFYNGTLKKDQRKYAEDQGDVLFATAQIASVGLDIERLNTIILATPQKDVTQAVGRVMRKVLKSGDIRPLIVDFSDDLSIFKSQSDNRVSGYKKSKYQIEKYCLLDGKIVSPSIYSKAVTHTVKQSDFSTVYTNYEAIFNIDVIEEDAEIVQVDPTKMEQDSDSDDEEAENAQEEQNYYDPNSYAF